MKNYFTDFRVKLIILKRFVKFLQHFAFIDGGNIGYFIKIHF